MDDKKLLMLAAKAAGVVFTWDGWADAPMVLTEDGTDTRTWNPLADDGDALRLAVQLQMVIYNDHVMSGQVFVSVGEETFDPVFTGSDDGKPVDTDGVIPSDYVNTRRAIVQAAAEIGRAMP